MTFWATGFFYFFFLLFFFFYKRASHVSLFFFLTTAALVIIEMGGLVMMPVCMVLVSYFITADVSISQTLKKKRVCGTLLFFFFASCSR